MNKKLLLKAFALLVALSSNVGASAYDFAASGMYFNIIGTNAVEVTYNDNNASYTSYSGNVDIPSTITYDGTTYNVTRIGNFAFRNSGDLTGVTIPNSITRIGNFAFYECINLTDVYIPWSVTYLGYDAFGKTGLTGIDIPNSVTYIGSEVCYKCPNLLNVRLSESITSIDMRSFQDCANLRRIIIPDGVTTIYSDAFKGCTNLTEVTLPRSTTTIKSGVFSGCTALTNVTCFAPTPPSLYDNNVFSTETYNNATLNVPSSSYSAYQAADGWKLFNNVNPLPYDFVVHNLMYVITSSTTAKCIGSVLRDPTDSWAVEDEACGFIITEIAEEAFADCPNITSVKIGANVQKIGSAAFLNCSGLTKIIIPDAVTYVGGLAFYGCSSLSSVEIGKNCRFNSTTGYSMNIFKGCTSLTSITCLSEEPWEFMEPMFDQATYNNATLWVPGGKQDAYRNTNYWNKFSHIRGIYTLDEALNVPGGNIHFYSSDNYPWVVDYDDYEMWAHSGNAGVHNSSSLLFAHVWVEEEGTAVRFQLQTRGEEGTAIYDECRFEIDGNMVFSFGTYASDGWAIQTSTLSPGGHLLTWSYNKDGSVNPEGDYFAIKAVELIPPAAKRGDVNRDGDVSIADVTALIDYLLSGDDSGINLDAANCNNDSDVSIADVTALIDYLLSGNW